MHIGIIEILEVLLFVMAFIYAIARAVRKWKRDKEEYEYFKRENDKYRNK